MEFNYSNKKIISGEANFFNSVFLRNFKNDNFIDQSLCNVTLSKSKNSIVVLNALDNCFGHALLKLFFSIKYISQNKSKTDFLLILPKALNHFVKDSEGLNILCIDMSFSKLEKCYILNKEIEKITYPYSEILIEGTETYSEFDFNFLKNELELFGKTDINLSDNKIIFYYRSDYFRKWAGIKQVKQIVKLFSFLKDFFDSSVKFYVLGDRDKNHFPAWIVDERVSGFSPEIDHRYNSLFSSSLICIGLTGSHMLFPSIFSDCTVHLHPSHKYKNMAEDTISSLNSNEIISAYKHLYYFSNHNCSGLDAVKLGTQVLLHYQALAEKKYKILVKENISQKKWLDANYPFLNNEKIDNFRRNFLSRENKKNMVGYYINKFIG